MKTVGFAVLAVAAAISAVPASASVLPWIENDYPHARSLALARHVPIFVEAWAPW
jgi:hypothetical protein